MLVRGEILDQGLACPRGPQAATVREMESQVPSGLALARVRLVCGRIVGGAQAIARAHRLQAVSEGTLEPWTAEYHREAVRIYSMSLPRSYQRNFAVLFRDSVETMAAMFIPASLADDWVIVEQYMIQASLSIEQWLASGESKSARRVKIPASEMEDRTPPGIIRFDLLAALTTSEGAKSLERAALAVQQHVNVQSLATLNDKQRRLLNMVASGVKVADMAAEFYCSERSVHRALAKLWMTLGVSDRDEGLRKAASEGLLDSDIGIHCAS